MLRANLSDDRCAINEVSGGGVSIRRNCMQAVPFLSLSALVHGLSSLGQCDETEATQAFLKDSRKEAESIERICIRKTAYV